MLALPGREAPQEDVQRHAEAVHVALGVIAGPVLDLRGGVEVGPDGAVGSAPLGAEDALGGDGRFAAGCARGCRGGGGGVVGSIHPLVRRTVQISGQAKVRKADLEIVGVGVIGGGGSGRHEKYVLGLDIAMDDPPLVQGGQRLEELSDDDGGLPLGVARPDGLGLSAPLPADILGGCGG